MVDTALCENKYPHITLSCTENVKPAYSNQLFDDENICEDIELELVGKFNVVEF